MRPCQFDEWAECQANASYKYSQPNGKSFWSLWAYDCVRFSVIGFEHTVGGSYCSYSRAFHPEGRGRVANPVTTRENAGPGCIDVQTISGGNTKLCLGAEVAPDGSMDEMSLQVWESTLDIIHCQNEEMLVRFRHQRF